MPSIVPRIISIVATAAPDADTARDELQYVFEAATQGKLQSWENDTQSLLALVLLCLWTKLPLDINIISL